jgi:hypothetical protein
MTSINVMFAGEQFQISSRKRGPTISFILHGVATKLKETPPKGKGKVPPPCQLGDDYKFQSSSKYGHGSAGAGAGAGAGGSSSASSQVRSPPSHPSHPSPTEDEMRIANALYSYILQKNPKSKEISSLRLQSFYKTYPDGKDVIKGFHKTRATHAFCTLFPEQFKIKDGPNKMEKIFEALVKP